MENQIECRMYFFKEPFEDHKLSFEEFEKLCKDTWNYIDYTDLEYEKWVEKKWNEYLSVFERAAPAYQINKFVAEEGKEKDVFEELKAKREDGDQLVPQWEW